MSDKFFVHPTGIVDEGAEVGDNTKIWHFSHVMKGAKIGRGCNLGQNVVVHSTVQIGYGVKIQNNVSLYDGVMLEDYVFCGPSCVFTNIFNPRSEVNRNSQEHYREIRVKRGASIGANATIVCGAFIGRYAFVGAGAVVTKDVGDYELVFGTPAKRQGWMCECGEKLTFVNNEAQCSACEKEYNKIDNKVSRVEI